MGKTFTGVPVPAGVGKADLEAEVSSQVSIKYGQAFVAACMQTFLTDEKGEGSTSFSQTSA